MSGLVEKVVVAVPARLQSSRLPNKLLADIGGQPMIQRVLERCREAEGVDAVVLCTDSAQLRSWRAGASVLMTAEAAVPAANASLLLRMLMALAWGDQPVEPSRTAVINVQGDQPFLDPAVIEEWWPSSSGWIRCRPW